MGGREGVVREVMKTIHPSPDVSDAGREKEGLKFWKLSLKCVNQSHGRGASLQVSVSVLIYVTGVSLLFWTRWKSSCYWNSAKSTWYPVDPCLHLDIGMCTMKILFCIHVLLLVTCVLMMCHVLCVQKMLEETVERTSSWLLPSPMLMAPLRSTRWREKRPRSRFHTARLKDSPLLPTAPMIPLPRM